MSVSYCLLKRLHSFLSISHFPLQLMSSVGLGLPKTAPILPQMEKSLDIAGSISANLNQTSARLATEFCIDKDCYFFKAILFLAMWISA